MISILAIPIERPHPTRAFIALATWWTLMIGGVLSVAYAGYVITAASVYQAIETRRFEYNNPSLRPHISAEGDVIGEIKVDAVGLKAIVVQGDSARILQHAVGHLPDTALPGEPGNVALAGHRDTFFRPLRHIRLGDIITIDVPGQQFRYKVDSTLVVTPRESRVLQPSTGRELILITCFPFGYIGPAPNRFIVRAREIQPSR